MYKKNGDEEDKDENAEIAYGFGKPDEHKGQAIKAVEIGARLLTRSCQILLSITSILNGVFLGATWYYDRDEKVSAGIICINLGVIGFVFGAISFATNKIY